MGTETGVSAATEEVGQTVEVAVESVAGALQRGVYRAWSVRRPWPLSQMQPVPWAVPS